MEKKVIINVECSNKLIDILVNKFNMSNKSIKNYIKNDMVYLNNKIIKNNNIIVNKGDIITFYFNKEEKIINRKLHIIYEDKDIIVVNKDYGLLTIGNYKEKDNTLYREVSDYVKKTNKNNKIFVVHRLDQDTSGLVLFAKNMNIQEKLQSNWNDIVKERIYYCIIPGRINESGVIKSFIDYNHNQIGYSTLKDNGNYAITEYKLEKYNNNYSLVRVNILTGKRNQIRIHMKDNFRAIVGDKKYGSNINPIKRLCLHANKLSLIDPRTNKLISFESPIPNEMMDLVK